MKMGLPKCRHKLQMCLASGGLFALVALMLVYNSDIKTRGTLQQLVLKNAWKFSFSLFSVSGNSAIWNDMRGPLTDSRCGRHLLTVFLNAVVKSREEIQQLMKKVDKELQTKIGNHVQALDVDMATFVDLIRSPNLTGNVSLHTLFIPETGDLKYEDVFREPASKPQPSAKSVLTEHLQKEIILRWFTDSFTAFPSYMLQNGLAWQTTKTGREIANFTEILKILKQQLTKEVTKCAIVEDASMSMQLANQLQAKVKQSLNEAKTHACEAAAKYIVCLVKYDGGSGFGSYVHRNAFCSIEAYYLGRKMIVDTLGRNWPDEFHFYQNFSFQRKEMCPVAQCQEIQTNNFQQVATTKSICQPGFHCKHIVDPYEIPEHIAEDLFRFHRFPPVWWVGHLIRYFAPEDEEFRNLLDSRAQSMGTQWPIVGIHIRGSDKIPNEANGHDLAEYMEHVANWYDAYESIHDRRVDRKVYIAADDPKYFRQAETRYPGYKFLYNETYAKYAKYGTRNTARLGKEGFMLDVYMLAKCDFVVCTLTSNVGRYVYEMMQTFHVDASRRLLSLDIDYYLASGVSRMFVSVIQHDGPIGEPLKRGDVIDYTPNNWRNPHMLGFIYGQNRRTKKTGFFPRYKLVEVFKRVKTSL